MEPRVRCFNRMENDREAMRSPDEFIWPGFKAGKVGSLVAPGGTGKSFWALEAAMSLICARDKGSDLVAMNPPRSGNVVYVTGEDSWDDIYDRMESITKYMGPAARDEVAKRLHVQVSDYLDLMQSEHGDWAIEKWCDARLVVLDVISCFHCAEENSNSDMTRLLYDLGVIARQTGAGILYLHHVNKLSVREGQIGHQLSSRGAGALVDRCRWAAALVSMSKNESLQFIDSSVSPNPIGNRHESYIRLSVAKASYSKRTSERWYRRGDDGVLLPVELTANRKTRRFPELKHFKEVNGENEWWK